MVVDAIGWELYLGIAEQEAASAPGDVAKRCQRCRCATQQGAEGRVGEVEPGLPQCSLVADWGLKAWQRFERFAPSTPGRAIQLRGCQIVAKEIFAGAGRWTRAMQQEGQETPAKRSSSPIPWQKWNLPGP